MHVSCKMNLLLFATGILVAMETLGDVTTDSYFRYRWSDVRQNATRAMSDVCGVSRLCETKKNYRPCNLCDECWCDSACVKYGDCCIDKLIDDFLLNTTLADTLPFQAPNTKCIDTRVRTVYGDPTNYTMITSCPRVIRHGTGAQRTVWREKCDASGNIDDHQFAAKKGVPVSKTAFWDNWPVYSKPSGVSYKNEQCAQCHGETTSHLIKWNLQIACGSALTHAMRMSEYDVIDFVLTDPSCHVTFTSTNGVKVRRCQYGGINNDVRVGVCNATGRIKVYDPFLWKACEVFEGPSVKDTFTEITYKNAFCIMCQTDRFYKPSARCGNVVGSTFFLVISPKAVRRMVEEARSQCGVCGSHQVWDPYTMRCRNVHCRPGSYLSQNATEGTFRCRADDTESKGLSYSLYLNANVTSADGNVLKVDVDTLRRFKTVFIDLLEKYLLEDTDVRNPNLVVGSTHVFLKVYNPPPTSSSSGKQKHPFQLTPKTSDPEPSTLTLGVSMNFWYPELISPYKLAHRLTDLDFKNWTVSMGSDQVDRVNATFWLVPGNPKALINTTSSSSSSSSGSMDGGEINEIEYFTQDNETAWLVADSTYVNNRFWKSVEPGDLTEVRNTLLCPYFVADESIDVRLVENAGKSLQSSFQTSEDQVLVHNASGLMLTFRDFFKFPDGRLIVCAPELMTSMKEKLENEKREREEEGGLDDDFALAVTSFICLSVSCVCLTITLVTYILFRPLRTLPGKNIMALVVCLLCNMLSCLVANWAESGTIFCKGLGAATHFFLLCSVFWMTLGSWHVHQIFTHVLSNARSTTEGSRRFVQYCIVAFLPSFLIVTTTIVVNVVVNQKGDEDEESGESRLSQRQNNNENGIGGDILLAVNESFPCPSQTQLDIGYGEGVCYISDVTSILLAVALPLGMSFLCNVVLFVRTVWALADMTSQQKMLKKEQTSQIATYVKLSTITGLNWIPGLLGSLVESRMLAYLFVILAGLQGLFVFCAFVLNKRILGHYKTLLIPDPRTKNHPKYKDTNKNSSSTGTGNRKLASVTQSSNVDSPIALPRNTHLHDEVVEAKKKF